MQMKRRMERLVADYDHMLLLKSAVPNINFITNDLLDAPNRYLIELDVLSVTFSHDLGPVCHSPWLFDVNLDHAYPEKSSPSVLVAKKSKTPFHPHFGLRSFFSARAAWIDYDKYDPEESLADYIWRIARSLQFDPNYVRKDAAKIGNKLALRWYLAFKNIHKNLKSSLLPQYKAPTRKAFYILNNDSPRAKKNDISNPHALNKTCKKFEITECSPEHKPKQAAEPKCRAFEQSMVLRRGADSSHKLFITKSAYENLLVHIGWGSYTEKNRVEQGGILLGQAFIDSETGLTFAIIQEIIESRFGKGTSSHLELDHKAWKDMLDRADDVLDMEIRQALWVIGWYHTHPNELDVFMSGTDRATQTRLFEKVWQFAVVLNPHKKIWRVFWGVDSQECLGSVIDSDCAAEFLRGVSK